MAGCGNYEITAHADKGEEGKMRMVTIS